MSGIVVRPAATEHVAALVAFNQAMAVESEGKALDPAVLERGVHHLLSQPEDGFYLVAEQDTEPGPVRGALPEPELAGSLLVTFEWSDWRDGRFWWIQSVYVRPEFRRRGVYRAMHQRVRDLARQDGRACGLRLYVERENTGAMATYQAMGMVETHYRLYEEEF